MIVSTKRYVAVMTGTLCVVSVSVVLFLFDEYMFGERNVYVGDMHESLHEDLLCEQASYSVSTNEGSDSVCPVRFIMEKGMEFLSYDVEASHLFFADVRHVVETSKYTHVGIYNNAVWQVQYTPSHSDRGCFMRVEILRNCSDNEIPEQIFEESINGTEDTQWTTIETIPDVEKIRSQMQGSL